MKRPGTLFFTTAKILFKKTDIGVQLADVQRAVSKEVTSLAGLFPNRVEIKLLHYNEHKDRPKLKNF